MGPQPHNGHHPPKHLLILRVEVLSRSAVIPVVHEDLSFCGFQKCYLVPQCHWHYSRVLAIAETWRKPVGWKRHWGNWLVVASRSLNRIARHESGAHDSRSDHYLPTSRVFRNCKYPEPRTSMNNNFTYYHAAIMGYLWVFQIPSSVLLQFLGFVLPKPNTVDIARCHPGCIRYGELLFHYVLSPSLIGVSRVYQLRPSFQKVLFRNWQDVVVGFSDAYCGLWHSSNAWSGSLGKFICSIVSVLLRYADTEEPTFLQLLWDCHDAGLPVLPDIPQRQTEVQSDCFLYLVRTSNGQCGVCSSHIVRILDLIHTAMICASNWNYLIGNFGNTDIADTIPWWASRLLPGALKFNARDTRTVAATIALTAILTFFVHWYVLSVSLSVRHGS